MNLIQTKDESTAIQLLDEGFIQIGEVKNGIWTFANNKITFSNIDTSKIMLTNKLMF